MKTCLETEKANYFANNLCSIVLYSLAFKMCKLWSIWQGEIRLGLTNDTQFNDSPIFPKLWLHKLLIVLPFNLKYSDPNLPLHGIVIVSPRPIHIYKLQRIPRLFYSGLWSRHILCRSPQLVIPESLASWIWFSWIPLTVTDRTWIHCRNGPVPRAMLTVCMSTMEKFCPLT